MSHLVKTERYVIALTSDHGSKSLLLRSFNCVVEMGRVGRPPKRKTRSASKSKQRGAPICNCRQSSCTSVEGPHHPPRKDLTPLPGNGVVDKLGRDLGACFTSSTTFANMPTHDQQAACCTAPQRRYSGAAQMQRRPSRKKNGKRNSCRIRYELRNQSLISRPTRLQFLALINLNFVFVPDCAVAA